MPVKILQDRPVLAADDDVMGDLSIEVALHRKIYVLSACVIFILEKLTGLKSGHKIVH
jgi:hypothetical protein